MTGLFFLLTKRTGHLSRSEFWPELQFQIARYTIPGINGPWGDRQDAEEEDHNIVITQRCRDGQGVRP
jgi:hypothetical protein